MFSFDVILGPSDDLSAKADPSLAYFGIARVGADNSVGLCQRIKYLQAPLVRELVASSVEEVFAGWL